MNFNELKKELSIIPSDKIVFVGLGNWMRRDDAAGLILTEQIENSGSFYNALFLKACTTPENYLSEILKYNPQLVIMIDVAKWGGAPGEVSWVKNENISDMSLNTHTYSISLIEKYLKANSNMQLKYLVIEPYNTDFGFSLSEPVEKKINQFFN